jgi:multicomponent Na+:H+ antiporter subunit A
MTTLIFGFVLEDFLAGALLLPLLIGLFWLACTCVLPSDLKKRLGSVASVSLVLSPLLIFLLLSIALYVSDQPLGQSVGPVLQWVMPPSQSLDLSLWVDPFGIIFLLFLMLLLYGYAFTTIKTASYQRTPLVSAGLIHLVIFSILLAGLSDHLIFTFIGLYILCFSLVFLVGPSSRYLIGFLGLVFVSVLLGLIMIWHLHVMNFETTTSLLVISQLRQNMTVINPWIQWVLILSTFFLIGQIPFSHWYWNVMKGQQLRLLTAYLLLPMSVGLYLLVRFSPLLSAHHFLADWLPWLGIVSSILSSWWALTREDDHAFFGAILLSQASFALSAICLGAVIEAISFWFVQSIVFMLLLLYRKIKSSQWTRVIKWVLGIALLGFLPLSSRFDLLWQIFLLDRLPLLISGLFASFLIFLCTLQFITSRGKSDQAEIFSVSMASLFIFLLLFVWYSWPVHFGGSAQFQASIHLSLEEIVPVFTDQKRAGEYLFSFAIYAIVFIHLFIGLFFLLSNQMAFLKKHMLRFGSVKKLASNDFLIPHFIDFIFLKPAHFISNRLCVGFLERHFLRGTLEGGIKASIRVGQKIVESTEGRQEHILYVLLLVLALMSVILWN